MWRALRLAVAALAACCFASVAAAQQAPLIPQNPSFAGPGSPGFLPTCGGIFSVANFVEGTSYTQFGAGLPWVTAGVGGGGATTVSGTPDTAPDGSATAARVTFGSISSATQASALTQSVGNSVFAGYYNWTAQSYVKVVTQPVPGYMSFWIYNEGTVNQGSLSNSQNYVEIRIPADGQWHLLANYIPANWVQPTHHTVTIGFGYDGRDPNQPSTVGTTTAGVLDIWEPQFAEGHSEGGKGWPFVANASTTNPSNPSPFYLSCPPQIAFRDFSRFKPLNTALHNTGLTSQITVQVGTAGQPPGSLNLAGVNYYEWGGTGDPFIGSPAALQVSGTYAGQLCGPAAVTDGTVSGGGGNHNQWPGFVVYCTPAGSGMAGFTEVQPGKPQLLIPGYTPSTCTTTGSGACGGTNPCVTVCSTAQTLTSPGLTYNSSNGQMTATTTGVGTNIPVGVDVTLTGVSPATVSGTSIGTVTITGVPWQVVSTTASTITFQLVGTSGANTGVVPSGGSYTWTSGGTITGFAPWNSYSLHGSWLPRMTTSSPTTNGKACQAWGVYYEFCIIFSAQSATNGNGGNSVFLAYSHNVDVGYCVWGLNQLCNNGSPSAIGGPTSTQPTGLMTTPNSNITSGQLPTVVCLPVGCPANATLYAITPPGNQNFLGFSMWTSPAGDGVHWTFAGWVTQPVQAAIFTGSTTISTANLVVTSPLGGLLLGQTVTGLASVPAGTTLIAQQSGTTGGAGTYTMSQNATATQSSGAQAMMASWPGLVPWDFGASRIDPFWFINGCGFGEAAWTNYKGSEWQPYFGGTPAKKDQAISLGVWTDVRGPVYQMNNSYFASTGAGNGSGPVGATGAILSLNSPIYNTLATIGETQFYEDLQGNFNAIFNTDSGGAYSSGVGGSMPNACAAH